MPLLRAAGNGAAGGGTALARRGAAGEAGPVPLHLIKLAVGVKDVTQLREIQTGRARTDPPLRHRTRSMPRRAAEVTEGGSLYWVVAGFVQVRQRVLEIREDSWEDGTACAGLVLDPALVAVAARPVKPFQGWRYLAEAAAPADVVKGAAAAEGLEALPARMREELRSLGLL
jgi:hypothetical protein